MSLRGILRSRLCRILQHAAVILWFVNISLGGWQTAMHNMIWEYERMSSPKLKQCMHLFFKLKYAYECLRRVYWQDIATEGSIIITMLHKMQNMSLLKLKSRSLFLSHPPGSQPGLCSPHRSLHVAPPLVHVGGYFCHAAPHRALPHLVRVEQPLRHDATWQEQAASLLLLLRPQSLLRHSVRTYRRHQGTVAFLCVINRHCGNRRKEWRGAVLLRVHKQWVERGSDRGRR